MYISLAITSCENNFILLDLKLSITSQKRFNLKHIDDMSDTYINNLHKIIGKNVKRIEKKRE